MDILRKELNQFYDSQGLSQESLDHSLLKECINAMGVVANFERDCRVITDSAKDYCHIWGGRLAKLIGLSDSDDYYSEMDSSDEDEIYNRIHPEDIVDKRLLEYEFFKFADKQPVESKLHYKATCRLRIKDKSDNYVYIDNSTRILELSPIGKIWLILCCYDLSPNQHPSYGIDPRIVNCHTGEIKELELSEKHANILTPREKEILTLIKEGKPSKLIAAILEISIHTVNRHRQNIIEKLSVGNSLEAIRAATLMRVL